MQSAADEPIRLGPTLLGVSLLAGIFGFGHLMQTYFKPPPFPSQPNPAASNPTIQAVAKAPIAVAASAVQPINRPASTPSQTSPFNLAEAAAKAGNADAMRTIARMLLDGDGVVPDPEAGFAWLRKSAAAGNCAAEIEVARALDDGSLQSVGTEASGLLFAAWSKGCGASDSELSALLTDLSPRTITAIQQRLTREGPHKIPADGKAGERTKAALVAWIARRRQ